MDDAFPSGLPAGVTNVKLANNKKITLASQAEQQVKNQEMKVAARSPAGKCTSAAS